MGLSTLFFYLLRGIGSLRSTVAELKQLFSQDNEIVLMQGMQFR